MSLKGITIHENQLSLYFDLTKSLSDDVLKGAGLKKGEVGWAYCSVNSGIVEVHVVGGGTCWHKGKSFIKNKTHVKRLDAMATRRVKQYVRMLLGNGVEVVTDLDI